MSLATANHINSDVSERHNSEHEIDHPRLIQLAKRIALKIRAVAQCDHDGERLHLSGLVPNSLNVVAYRIRAGRGAALAFLEAPSESAEWARVLSAELGASAAVGHLRQRALLRSLIPAANRAARRSSTGENTGNDRLGQTAVHLSNIFCAPVVSVEFNGGFDASAKISYHPSIAVDGLPHVAVPDCLFVLHMKSNGDTEGALYVIVIDGAKRSEHVTLRQCVDFSPAFLKSRAIMQQLVVYQILCSLRHCLQVGLVPRWLSLHTWNIDARGYLTLNPLAFSCDQSDSGEKAACGRYRHKPLYLYTDEWCCGRLSNLDYLMVLNEFAGRTDGDMRAHPIVPWVCDFSLPQGGWRDLTQSKYRLSKGDRAVDANYAQGAVSVPHHVAEPLSDIAYCVYMARRLSKETLQRVWVPDEYPSSIKRLYAWTPDECIPSFYSQPEIVKSLHSDMADLQCPEWASSAEAFVKWHRQMLESDFVSQRLNHWIDLMFGYKLSGEDAVLSKNVHLTLADDHHDLRTYGTVQLFTRPHPVRSSSNRPCAAGTHSMDEIVNCLMNPLYELSNRPPQAAFKEKSASVDASRGNIAKCDSSNDLRSLLNMIYSEHASSSTSVGIVNLLYSLGCVLTEIVSPVHFRQFAAMDDSQLELRRQTAKKVAGDFGADLLPAFMRDGIELLLHVRDDAGTETLRSMHQADSLSPETLLQPISALFRFAQHSAVTADWLCLDAVVCSQITRIQLQVDELGNCAKVLKPDAVDELRSLCDERIRLYSRFSSVVLSRVPDSSVAMHWASIGVDLFAEGCTSAAAFWSLFGPIAKSIGREGTGKLFADSLKKLFDVDAPCTSKILKLYHRTFQSLLMSRLGCGVYLHTVVPLLVEATSGERNSLLMTELDYFNMVRLDVDGGAITKEEFSVKREVVNSFSEDTTGDSGQSEGKVQFAVDIADSSSSGNFRPATDMDRIDSESEIDTSTGADNNEQTIDKEPKAENRNHSPAHKISSVAEDTLTWLVAKLNCVLASKGVLAPLLRMLALCYWGDRLQKVPNRCSDDVTVNGDLLAGGILACLESATLLYGSALVTCQYLPFCADLMEQASRRLAGHLEGGLIGCVVLLEHVFPLLPDRQLLDVVQEPIVDSILFPAVRLASSLRAQFSDNRARHVLATKCAGAMHALSHRLGVDNVKRHIMAPLQRLLCTFDLLYVLEGGTLKSVQWCDGNGDVKGGSGPAAPPLFASQIVLDQLLEAFDPQFAQFLYALFVPVCGRRYFELSVPNSDLFAALIAHGDSRLFAVPPLDLPTRKQTKPLALHTSLDTDDPQFDVGRSSAPQQHYSAGNKLSSSHADVTALSVPPAIAANRIRRPTESIGTGSGTGLKSRDASQTSLSSQNDQPTNENLIRGNWLAHWRHQLAACQQATNALETSSLPQFNHVPLASFVGHTASVRRIKVLHNEISFASCSQDKTVRLWSLNSGEDGSAKYGCRYSYTAHKRPLSDICVLDAHGLIASTDGAVHLWDAYVGSTVRELSMGLTSDGGSGAESSDGSALVHTLAPLESTGHILAAAANDRCVRVIDVRMARMAFVLRFAPSHAADATVAQGAPRWPQYDAGCIQCMCTSSETDSASLFSGGGKSQQLWIAAGFSSGLLCVLDARNGKPMSYAHVPGHDFTQLVCLPPVGRAGSMCAAPPQLLSTQSTVPDCATIWSASSCQIVNRLPLAGEPISSAVAVGGSLLFGHATNRLRIFPNRNDMHTPYADSRLRGDVLTGQLHAAAAVPMTGALLLGSSAGGIALVS